MSIRVSDDRLLPLIYEASVEPETWPEILQIICDRASVTTALLGNLPADRMWEGVMWGANLDPSSVEACLQEGVIDRSVFAHALTKMPQGCLAELGSAGSHAIYDDRGAKALLSAQCLTDGLFGPVTRDTSRVVGLACLNDDKRGAIGDHSSEWIRSLVPHVASSLQISRRIERSRAEAASLRQTLSCFSVGVMSITPELVLRYCNAEGERVLKACDGIARQGGRLRLTDRAAEDRLRSAVAKFATESVGDTPGCIFVERPSGAPSYTLVVAAGRAAMSAGCPTGAATVFVTDPAGPSALPSPALLAEGLGLTATEAEVARLAAMGRGMAFVAGTLGISLNTARTHLKAVYSKTHVNSQAALTRLIADRFPSFVDLTEV